MADKEFSLVPRIVNASIAGVVGVTSVFPIDLVKTRLQNDQKAYRGMFDCAKKSFRAGGFLGMYKGMGVNVFLITPEKAIKLVVNDYFRNKLKTDKGNLTLFREMVAGAGAGASQIIVTTPMELLKIQQQDAGRTASKPPISANGSVAVQRITATQMAKILVKEHGILGLYKGMGATACRDITFSAIYFPLFANLNKLGRDSNSKEPIPLWQTLIAGCIAGGVASISVNPFDVIKTRLQTIEKGSGGTHYKGIIDCFAKTWQQEGFKAFFKGGGCRMMVIAPLFGIAQCCYFLGVAEFLLGYPVQRAT